MDIVVKLPDKDYSVMLTKIMLACHGCKIIELPKGHGDLIDRDEVNELDERLCATECDCCTLDGCFYDRAETIIKADRSEE